MCARVAAEAEFERREEDVTVRGATATGADGAGSETVRPIDGGAVGFGGDEAGLALGAGLSQDEKKSSSSAAAVGCAADIEVSTPSTTMPFGNLDESACAVSYGKSITMIMWRTGLHLP